MELMNVYKENILVVDLEAKECDTEELSEELVEKALGGAAINMELYEQYKDRDPLIIGTGLLTGTFAPAGCGGVMTAKSPLTGKIAHVPFGIYAGVELKLGVVNAAKQEPESEKKCQKCHKFQAWQ